VHDCTGVPEIRISSVLTAGDRGRLSPSVAADILICIPTMPNKGFHFLFMLWYKIMGNIVLDWWFAAQKCAYVNHLRILLKMQVLT
jgi:hypothetical protein